ncbi:MAG: hypothetical protein EBY24_12215 [Betaproteobacteria bacterium]|nr:hypothetical protein [Betaproteobacteria bacterium]
MSSQSPSIALYDARPFFEKALMFGVRNGIIDQRKLDAICDEAPKGIVQIARYFGNEFLRPDLEKAKDRMLNLASLQLEHASGGDLRQAAQSLHAHSLLSRSKAGSDMLRALLAMPRSSHFGMNDQGGFDAAQNAQLARWSMANLADYQVELAKRSLVAQTIDAAVWMSEQLGMQAPELEDAGKDADAVIRTALLVRAVRGKAMPDWVGFEKMIGALRRQKTAIRIGVPAGLPDGLDGVVSAARDAVTADLPRILDATATARKLFDQTPSFIGRYFWVEDSLMEIDHHDRAASVAWDKALGGRSDDSSLLTYFLCLAAQATARTLMSEKEAASLVRKIRKTGLQPQRCREFIALHAPAQHQADYLRLWEAFADEASATLISDHDHRLQDALALLRRECNVRSP